MNSSVINPPESQTEMPPTKVPFIFQVEFAFLRLLLLTFGALMAYKFGLSMLTHAFSWDFPWLLGAGNHILTHHQLPTQDIFSWTFLDKPWVVYQWLFDVVAALGNQLMGLEQMLRLFAISVVALYTVLPLFGGLPKKIPRLFVLIPASLALFACSGMMELRPFCFTPLFLIAQWLLVQHFRQRQCQFKTVAIGFAVIYALWANIHIEVILGFMALGLMAVGDWLEAKGLYRFNPVDPDIEGQPMAFQQYLMLGLLGLGASLLNPYGVFLYTYMASLSSESYLNTLIYELQPPPFGDPGTNVFLVLFGFSVVLMTKARRVFPAQAILLLVVFSVLSLTASRFILGATIFFAFLLPKAVHHYWLTLKTHLPILDREVITRFNVYHYGYAAIVALGAVLFLAVPQVYPPLRYGGCQEILKSITHYQQDLRQPTDRLLNDPAIGGCMLLTDPEAPVFIDTRLHFYGADFTRQFINAQALKPGWQAFLGKWGINTVFLPKSAPLAWELKQSEGYATLYEDDLVLVLRKRSG